MRRLVPFKLRLVRCDNGLVAGRAGRAGRRYGVRAMGGILAAARAPTRLVYSTVTDRSLVLEHAVEHVQSEPAAVAARAPCAVVDPAATNVDLEAMRLHKAVENDVGTTACGSNVYFLVAVNGEIYLPLRLSIWELSGNYLRVQTCRRDRLTGLSAHH